MKIIIHLENLYRGGIDTAIIKLIKNWPDKNDYFLLISNFEHPSNLFFKQHIGNKNKLITYKVPLFSLILSKLPKYFNILVIKILIFLFIVPTQFILMLLFLIQLKADALLVVNGGYPGGETSRITSIIWKILRRKNNFHNIHNLAVIPQRGIEKNFEKIVDFFLIHSVDKFICVSKVSKSYLKKREAFGNLDKIIYIYNGITEIEKNNLNLKNKLNIPKNSKLCLVLASYEPRKGHEFLIKSFNLASKKIKDLHLVFIGHLSYSHISYYNNLKKYLNNNIHFIQFLPNASGLIDQSDILLLGSQEYESFGLVALEGMIQKTPIVATNIDAFCEVIGNNNLGIIKDKTNIEDYALQIIKCLTNQKLRQSVIDYGFKRSKLFSEKEMSKNYHNTIKSSSKIGHN